MQDYEDAQLVVRFIDPSSVSGATRDDGGTDIG